MQHRIIDLLASLADRLAMVAPNGPHGGGRIPSRRAVSQAGLRCRAGASENDRNIDMASTARTDTADDLRDRYLELLKRVLSRSDFETSFSLVRREWSPSLRSSLRDLLRRLRHGSKVGESYGAILRRWIKLLGNKIRDREFDLLKRRGYQVVTARSDEKRRGGLDWPTDAETMIGMERLDNLQYCVETVLRESIEGDLIETGVWRGGASILMRGVLAAYGVTDRTVWVADSFQGLPPPDPAYAADADSEFHKDKQLAISEETVRNNFRRYGLLDNQVRFLAGWFKDTLPSAPIEKLSVARLDGDMYESTIQALESLYPKVIPGGFVIIDDYAIRMCRQAVDDYRNENQIHDEVIMIDDKSAYWRKLP